MAAREYPNEPTSFPATLGNMAAAVIFAFISSLLTAALLLEVFQLGPTLAQLLPEAPYGAAWFGIVLGFTGAAMPMYFEMLWGEQDRSGQPLMEQTVTVGQVRLIAIILLAALVDLTVLFLAALAAGAFIGPVAALLAPLADKTAAGVLGISLGIAVIWILLKAIHAIGLARDLDYSQVIFWARSRPVYVS